jgi:hypothetical protein
MGMGPWLVQAQLEASELAAEPRSADRSAGSPGVSG